MVPNVRPCVSEYCEFYSGNKGSGSRGETGGAWGHTYNKATEKQKV